MTDDRFDRLSKLVARRTSRRSLLRGLAASALAAAFGKAAASDAEARHACLPGGRLCRVNNAGACCSGVCLEQEDGSTRCAPTCRRNGDCASGVCVNGACLPAQGEIGDPCDDAADCVSHVCEAGFCAGCDTCFSDICGIESELCGVNEITSAPCVCAAVATGDACACFQPTCGAGPFCSPEAPDCPDGFACVSSSCCGFAVCAPLCDTVFVTTTAAAGARSGGLWQ